MLQVKALKVAPPSRPGRGLIPEVQAEMAEAGDKVSVCQLCTWFEVPRRTVYYKRVKSALRVNDLLAARISRSSSAHAMPATGRLRTRWA